MSTRAALRASSRILDVIIVGAGPAGLSAALVLGRARRRVLICDDGTPRSWAAKHMHGFVTCEGMSPDQFRSRARSQLKPYRNVRFTHTTVTKAVRLADSTFRVSLGRKVTARCRKLLIATGLFDHLPRLAGIEELFGVSVFQCPYCDGWEMRDRPLAIYGKRQRGFEMARALTAWSRDLVLCTDGPSGYEARTRRELARNSIELNEKRILRLEGSAGRLRRIVFHDDSAIRRTALFFDTPSSAQSRLAESLGCLFTRNGGVRCGQYEATNVPGVFAAGNIIRDVQLSIVAAAEGARAAFGINRALTREDFERRSTGRQVVVHPPLVAQSARR